MKKLLKVLSLMVTVIGFSGCKDDFQDIKNLLDNMAKLEMDANHQAEQLPYRDVQQMAFKSYFSELMQIALAAKNDAKFAQRLNTAISKSDLKAVCGKLFMPKRRWQNVVERCTRNRFFLCAEEIRVYPETVLSIRAILGSDQQQRFDQTLDCRDVL